VIHQGTVILNTRRLRLRPYLPGDAEAMFAAWANDPLVTEYLTWEPHGSIEVTEGIVRQWIESYCSDTVYHWGITRAGELIGDIAVVTWNEKHESCEIGYCLTRSFWGQGIMTEALTSVMLYLFETIDFHRITLRHDSRNPASGRVMAKAGLVYEGCMREAMKRRDDSFADVCIYGAINGLWQAQIKRASKP
jgi:ribosomal-protein-alanine N-acetyltransferase